MSKIVENKPLVSIPVVTYNSSKFVIETLESIKAQTYQYIELIVSDDCSTDNTVELCRQWIEENKERFVRAELLTVEQNTGVSANCNRANDACKGEWIKGIAGDDLLMPDCVENCVGYIDENPNTIYLFGKIEAFGANEQRNKFFEEKVFDYSFFDLTIPQQLERLVFDGNCIPASTVFYNRSKIIELGITNDERIPLLEDWPKWINVLEKGVRLSFLDKKLVKYRLHNSSLSTSERASANSIFSNRLFTLYYLYPRWAKKAPEMAAKRVANEYVDLYKELLLLENQITQIRSSKAYRLGKWLLRPLSWMRG